MYQRWQHDAKHPLLDVQGLWVEYEAVTALEDITFRLHPGERVAVVGPNGAGKSTLFKAVAGLLTPTRGQVTVYGGAPDRHLCIGYVPQRSQVDWDFPVTVADVVMMGRLAEIGLLGWPRKRDREAVQQALETVRLADLADRQISELSGGQQQRMFIARALAQQAELMLMDEPLTGLDLPSQEDILHILDDLQARGVTVMVATHDLDQAARAFDKVLLLNRRLYGFGPPAEVLQAERLLAAYGGHLRVLTAENVLVGDTCCQGGNGHEPH